LPTYLFNVTGYHFFDVFAPSYFLITIMQVAAEEFLLLCRRTEFIRPSTSQMVQVYMSIYICTLQSCCCLSGLGFGKGLILLVLVLVLTF